MQDRLRLELERPGIAEWATISNAYQAVDQIAGPEDIEALPESRAIITRSLFSKNGWASVDETLRGARLNY